MSMYTNEVKVVLNGVEYCVRQVTPRQIKRILKEVIEGVKDGNFKIASSMDLIESCESVIDEILFKGGKSFKEQGVSLMDADMDFALNFVDPLLEVNRSFLLTLASKYNINLLEGLAKLGRQQPG
jgi:hypothetical protein